MTYPLIIVDDEDITRMAISGYIQRKHHEFHVAGIFSNGGDALKFLHEHTVNVVITDIRMPRMDGLELANHIYKDFPGIIVIIISGYSEFEYARKAISLGVANYLLKPIDFMELSQNLEHVREKLDELYPAKDTVGEEISLFFTDLIGGAIETPEELNRRFEMLSLEGKPEDYKGCQLVLTLEENDTLSRWQYGRENLATALQNGLRMVLTNYHIHHLFRNGMRYFFVILSTDKIPDFSLDELNGALYHLLHFSSNLQVSSAFESIASLLTSNVNKSENKKQMKADSVSGDDDIVIKKALNYIHAHYADDLTREDVADAVFLSSAYFSRFFKQKTGLSFIDYLTTVRMQKAIELLGTRMKVGDIAQKVGYQSRNRFFINFRQYSGYNPTEYRRQILRMEDVHEDTEE